MQPVSPTNNNNNKGLPNYPWQPTAIKPAPHLKANNRANNRSLPILDISFALLFCTIFISPGVQSQFSSVGWVGIYQSGWLTREILSKLFARIFFPLSDPPHVGGWVEVRWSWLVGGQFHQSPLLCPLPTSLRDGRHFPGGVSLFIARCCTIWVQSADQRRLLFCRRCRCHGICHYVGIL